MKKILTAALFTSFKLLGSSFTSPYYEEEMRQFESSFYEQGMAEEKGEKKLDLIKKAAFHGDVRALFQLSDVRMCCSFDKEFQFLEFEPEFRQLIRLSKDYFSTETVLFPAMFYQYLETGLLSLEKDLVKSFFWAKKVETLCDKDSKKVGREMIVTNLSSGLLYFNLGVLYNQGIDFVPRYLEAAKVFEQSAELGCSQAIPGLLSILETQPDIYSQEIRMQKLNKWYQKSGDLLKLAICKIRCPERSKEYHEGIKTLKQLAQKGNIPAKFELAKIQNSHEMMRCIARNPSELMPQQKARLGILMIDKKFGFDAAFVAAAYELLRQAKEDGIVCDSYLGYCYEKGIGVAQNYERAAAYYQQHIDEKTRDSMENKIISYNNLGVLHMYQYISSWDYHKAHQLFDCAIEHGHIVANHNKAYMLDHALGCERNVGESIRLYTTAADAGDPDAQYNLGLIYQELKQYDQAHSYYLKAGDQGDLTARNNRICLFLDGYKGADQTSENVREALFQNARDGSPESLITLASMLASGSEKLLIEKSPQDARSILEELLAREDLSNKHKMLAITFLYRLEDEVVDEPELQQEEQSIQAAQTPIEELSTATESLKLIRDPLRNRKKTRDIERALKRKEAFEQLKVRQQEEKSRDPSTQADHFTDVEIAILEEFASHQGAMKEREFAPILKLLGAKSTKSGYVIKWGAETVGGHRPHASDGTVDKGAVKEEQSLVQTVIPGKG